MVVFVESFVESFVETSSPFTDTNENPVRTPAKKSAELCESRFTTIPAGVSLHSQSTSLGGSAILIGSRGYTYSGLFRAVLGERTL